MAYRLQSIGDRMNGPGGPRLRLHLIGDFRAESASGLSVLPVSRKARALLALVAGQAPQPMRRDLAASRLWSAKSKEHAANSLRQALRELQLALAACGQPPILLASGGRLALPEHAIWIDIRDTDAIARQSAGGTGKRPAILCQDLRELDPAFDIHLDKLWKDLAFKQAFTPPPESWVTSPPLQPVVAGFAEAASSWPPFETAAEVSASQSQASGPSGLAPTEVAVRSHGWRIAVLPFRSLGSLPQQGLSLGLAEEVSAALARFRMPRQIATSSFWDGAGPSHDAMERCRAFNLDYVISGTIQTAGDRVRVTVTLLDVAMDFEVIWVSRFDGGTDDLFTLQDTIASRTVARIDPELLQRAQFNALPVRTASAAAHRAVLTAIQSVYGLDRKRFLQARVLLQQAIGLDDSYAAAHAWLAYWHIIAIGQGYCDDAAAAAENAGVAAERAIRLDPLDARAMTTAGHVKAYLLHDLDAAKALHQRAISLNPNLPIAWALHACASVYAGDHLAAIEEARTAIDLSPADPHVFFPEHALMMAQLFLRDLEAADALAATVLERKPGHASALRIRLAILGHLGRREAAAACLEQLRAIKSDVTIDGIVARPPLRNADRRYYAEGLRLAGLQN